MDETAFRKRLRQLIIDHINKTGIDLNTLNDTDIDIDVMSLFNTSNSGKDVFKTLPVELSLILLYSFVFIICFVGNSLVIAVLALNSETQTATNFFLLNLAVADLCVALFCVYQNLSVYIFSDWAFGDILCRMYHFVHALSYTASVYILVVISLERYLALVYPLLARRLLTMKKLKITIAFVWLLSSVCCFPRFIIYGTTEIDFGLGQRTMCILKQKTYDAKLYDVCYITLCFIIPLIIITVSYLRVCYHLYTSPLPGDTLQANRTRSTTGQVSEGGNSLSESSINLILERRKKVIKLLITIVVVFALFSAPFHARKLAQHFIKSYNVGSDYATMFTILTTLLLYSNSGVNPLIYLIFSKKLRRLMIETVFKLLGNLGLIKRYRNRPIDVHISNNILLPVNSHSDNANTRNQTYAMDIATNTQNNTIELNNSPRAIHEETDV